MAAWWLQVKSFISILIDCHKEVNPADFITCEMNCDEFWEVKCFFLRGDIPFLWWTIHQQSLSRNNSGRKTTSISECALLAWWNWWGGGAAWSASDGFLSCGYRDHLSLASSVILKTLCFAKNKSERRKMERSPCFFFLFRKEKLNVRLKFHCLSLATVIQKKFFPVVTSVLHWQS